MIFEKIGLDPRSLVVLLFAAILYFQFSLWRSFRDYAGSEAEAWRMEAHKELMSIREKSIDIVAAMMKVRTEDIAEVLRVKAKRAENKKEEEFTS